MNQLARKRAPPFSILARCAIALALLLNASALQASNGDPFEASNRGFHRFNQGLDRFAYRPLAHAYGSVTPNFVMDAIGNVSGNISVPSVVFNNLLQFDLESALSNSVRFTVNSTVGLGGMLDVAGSMGIPRQRTDFGETLHKLGVGSGAYLVLPFAGPSSQRDAAGLLFDLAFNPVNHVLPKDALAAATAVKGLDFLGSRYRNSAFLDSLLYEGEDSYTEVKLYYEQNRRYRLEGAYSVEFIDPFGLYDE